MTESTVVVIYGVQQYVFCVCLMERTTDRCLVLGASDGMIMLCRFLFCVCLYCLKVVASALGRCPLPVAKMPTVFQHPCFLPFWDEKNTGRHLAIFGEKARPCTYTHAAKSAR